MDYGSRMARVVLPLSLAILAVACPQEVPVNDTFPGVTARKILADSTSASITRVLRARGMWDRRDLDTDDRRDLVSALLRLEPDVDEPTKCLCGFGTNPEVTWEVKSATGNSVQVYRRYGCPSPIPLTVITDGNSRQVEPDLQGEGLRALHAAFEKAVADEQHPPGPCG